MRIPFMTVRVAMVVCAVLLAGSQLGCSSKADAPSSPDGPTALRGADLFVTTDTSPHDQLLAWESAGRSDDAAAIRVIADRPLATWFSHDPDIAQAQANQLATRAREAAALPVAVVYNLPHRDCGGHSAGGAASAEDYREWLTAVTRGLAGLPAVVILEPDAIAQTLTGCVADGVDTRLDLLRWAIETLTASPATLVYLDAGNPGWIADVPLLADRLRRAGIDHADGFALNVSNFFGTAENIEFGTRLSAELGGARFVVDTSRNGNGPYGHHEVDGGPAWCNPPGRALGTPPTTVDTGSELVDALLWIKVPGESDGACRPGEPPAGRWWPQYALDLVRNVG